MVGRMDPLEIGDRRLGRLAPIAAKTGVGQGVENGGQPGGTLRVTFAGIVGDHMGMGEQRDHATTTLGPRIRIVADDESRRAM